MKSSLSYCLERLSLCHVGRQSRTQRPAHRDFRVVFVERDVDCRFRFTAIQSPYGTRLAQAFGIDPADPDTNAVIHGGAAYLNSDAALTVLGALPGWEWVRALRAVPKPLRDAVYNLVARNRHRIFGKYEECFVPDADVRARVME